MPRRSLPALAALTLALAAPALAQEAMKPPGKLVTLGDKEKSYSATMADVVEVSVASNASLGPRYYVENIRVEFVGGFAPKMPPVVLVPPEKPLPGAPSYLKAFLAPVEAGEVKVKVTPIMVGGKPGEATTYVVKILP